jgi:hypothetical protein
MVLLSGKIVVIIIFSLAVICFICTDTNLEKL